MIAVCGLEIAPAQFLQGASGRVRGVRAKAGNGADAEGAVREETMPGEARR